MWVGGQWIGLLPSVPIGGYKLLTVDGSDIRLAKIGEVADGYSGDGVTIICLAI